MVELKVRRIGNSLGVVLPKEAAALLRVGEGDRLHLTEGPDGALRLTAYDPAFEEQMKHAGEGMRRYRNALRTLAK
jgi:putative addiction module antidote